jgi:SAM-dependent methyltransferase
MARRSQLIPWKTAGRATDQFASGDEVVRETGWVFNNAVGDGLTMAEFVATGDDEVPTYLNLFQLRGSDPSQQTFVEIGSGIGRMTCAFTREFGSVVACDLDAGFLERCRQVVARFGRPDRLRTIEVPDGDSLALDTNSADVAFSYITLQHCDEHDALALAAEAVRVTRSGGRIALNLRSRSRLDMVTLPAGSTGPTVVATAAGGDMDGGPKGVGSIGLAGKPCHADSGDGADRVRPHRRRDLAASVRHGRGGGRSDPHL